jgi:hypothetical protein
MKTKAPETRKEYTDHDSPWIRLDGTRPYNHHLWPTESWWISHDPKAPHCRNLHRFWFGIIALADGRYATDGATWLLDVNSTVPRWETEKTGNKGKPIIFADRQTAIRTAAAREIRQARWSRKWGSEGLTADELAIFINWTLEQVSIATTQEPWKPVKPIPEPPKPPKDETAGLELFDYNQPPKESTP